MCATQAQIAVFARLLGNNSPFFFHFLGGRVSHYNAPEQEQTTQQTIQSSAIKLEDDKIYTSTQ